MSGLNPEALIARAAALGLVLPAPVAIGCARHHALLVKWNATHNLTRVTDPSEAIDRHYLDSLLPASRLDRTGPSGRVLDIGSGAGFPGLVLALLWQGTALELVEPAQKRSSFLHLAIAELGLQARVSVSTAATSPAARVLSRATFPKGGRRPLADGVAPGGELWLWSVPGEVPGWTTEANDLGLIADAAVSYRLGDDRVLLRAHRA